MTFYGMKVLEKKLTCIAAFSDIKEGASQEDDQTPYS